MGLRRVLPALAVLWILLLPVLVLPVEARITPRPQLIKNPGFEQGLDYWSVIGRATVSSKHVYEGAYSATFSGTCNSCYIYQRLVSSYDQYDVIVHIYVSLENPGGFPISGVWVDNWDRALSVFGVHIRVQYGQPYVTIYVNENVVKDVPAPSDYLGRWLSIEIVVYRTSSGTYHASIYVDGVKYFEKEFETLLPVDTVVLAWYGENHRPYFDQVLFYDLS